MSLLQGAGRENIELQRIRRHDRMRTRLEFRCNQEKRQSIGCFCTTRFNWTRPHFSVLHALLLTSAIKPAISCNQDCWELVYVWCICNGTTNCSFTEIISSVWVQLIAGSIVTRCFFSTRLASARTCLQRSLHVVFAPRIIQSLILSFQVSVAIRTSRFLAIT